MGLWVASRILPVPSSSCQVGRRPPSSAVGSVMLLTTSMWTERTRAECSARRSLIRLRPVNSGVRYDLQSDSRLVRARWKASVPSQSPVDAVSKRLQRSRVVLLSLFVTAAPTEGYELSRCQISTYETGEHGFRFPRPGTDYLSRQNASLVGWTSLPPRLRLPSALATSCAETACCQQSGNYLLRRKPMLFGAR